MMPQFKKHYEKKKLPNGKKNPKYIDLLDEDKKIRDQEFACLSFISPEQNIKQREHFLFEEFVRQWDFNTSMKKFIDFLNFVSHKYDVPFENVTEDLKEFVEEEKPKLCYTILDDFKTFIETKEDELQKKFEKEHGFQTSTRGIKIRGVFPTQDEAELRCRMLRENDPNHDIFVGPVGVWIPFDPNAYKTGRVEHLEEELNQIMKNKQINEQQAKEEFDNRIKEQKQKAMEDNRKLAEKTGNVLTQTITEAGDLEEIKKKVDSLEVLSEEEIASRLFDTSDVVVGKTDHGQSRLVSGPFSEKKNA